jgi:iron complex outermembrane receptor protein
VTILTADVSTGRSGNELEVRSVSDELQLQGKAFNNKLTYITGLYVQDQRTRTIWPQTYFDLTPVAPPSALTNDFRIENKSYAVYAQGTYDLSSWIKDLAFTVGGRWTREDVDFEIQPLDTYRYGAAPESNTFQDPSWEVGLEYQATQTIFTYIKTRGSFRSGGFNGAAPAVKASATEGGNTFDSEHTQDIEAGVKYHGTWFGRPATLNFDVYNQWIQDVQRVEFPDPDGPGGLASIAVTANVPSERIRGVEAEVALAPLSWLQVGGSAALTDAVFTDGNIVLFGVPYKYGPVGDTPKYSGVFYTEFYAPTGHDVGSVSLRGEVYAQSEQYFSNASDSIAPGTRLPGYALINGRLTWSEVMGTGLTAALFGKNLANRTYFVGGMTLAAALGHNAAAVGEPRTYGLELSYKF